MRLHKYLAQEGILSRREAEVAIQNGFILVNGEPAQIGQRIDPDQDSIDWSQVRERFVPSVLAVHKPRGVVTNCPLQGETQVIDLLPIQYQRFSSIGRLDKDSEGLILFTNSGVIAKQGLQQDDPHWREYLVWTNDTITQDHRYQLESGVVILASKTHPLELTLLGDRYCKIRMNQGKNRQIRRMMNKVGLIVVRLKRIRFGCIALDALPKGAYRELDSSEIKQFCG